MESYDQALNLTLGDANDTVFHINHALLWIEAGWLGLGLLVLECNVGVVSQMRRSAYFLV